VSILLVLGSVAVGLGLGAMAMGAAGVTAASRASKLMLQSITGTEVEAGDAGDDELAAPLATRLLGPARGGLAKTTHLITPSSWVDRLRRNTALAGLGRMGVEGVLALKAAFAAGVALLLLLLALALQTSFGNTLLWVLVGAAVGFFGPDIWLARRGSSRQEEIRTALPETLDLLAIAVQAGMGLEGALDLVIQRLPGALGDEFHRVLQELQLGVSRREAFQNLRDRSEVAELSTFVLILTQADSLGTPLGQVLRGQAAEMRMLRRQRAREQGAKIPVALLFPLLLGLFPALMLMVMGPAIVSIIKAFSSGAAGGL
jgi:tight adherence protein C